MVDYYGLYIQDDFRVSNKLTLNIGLRWEHELGLREANNGMVVGFEGTATNVLAANVTGISPMGAVVYAGGKLGNTVGAAWRWRSDSSVPSRATY